MNTSRLGALRRGFHHAWVPLSTLLPLLLALPRAQAEETASDFTLTLRATDIEYWKAEAGGKVTWSARAKGEGNAATVGYESGGTKGEIKIELAPGKAPPAPVADSAKAGEWTPTGSFLAPRVRIDSAAWKMSFVAEMDVVRETITAQDTAWLDSKRAKALSYANPNCPLAPFSAECVPVAWEKSADGALQSLTVGLRLRKAAPGFRWTTLNGAPYPQRAPARPVPEPATPPRRRETPVEAPTARPVAGAPPPRGPADAHRYIAWTPLPFGANCNLQGGSFIPALRDGWVLPAGTGHVSVGFEIDQNDIDFKAGGANFTLDGMYYEFRQDVRYGVIDRFEVDAGVVSNGWSLGQKFPSPSDGTLLTGSSFDILSNFELGGKGQIWKEGENAVAGALNFKFPITGDEDNLTSSGGVDVALAVMGSYRVGWPVLHGQLGYAILGGDSVENVFFFSGGATFPISPQFLVLGQFQGNTGFLDEGLDEAPIEILLGVRWLPAPLWNVDAGLGFGILGDSETFLFGVRGGMAF